MEYIQTYYCDCKIELKWNKNIANFSRETLLYSTCVFREFGLLLPKTDDICGFTCFVYHLWTMPRQLSQSVAHLIFIADQIWHYNSIKFLIFLLLTINYCADCEGLHLVSAQRFFCLRCACVFVSEVGLVLKNRIFIVVCVISAPGEALNLKLIVIILSLC